MSATADKRTLRKKMKDKRAAMTPDAYAARSHMICEMLSRMLVFREAHRIYCYAPLPQEADLWELIDQLLARGDKQLAFPRVIGADGEMGHGWDMAEATMTVICQSTRNWYV